MEQRGPIPMVWRLRIRRDALAEVQGIPFPHWASQPRAPVLARGVPIASVGENQRGLHLSESQGCWWPRCSCSKALTWTHSLTNSLILVSNKGAAAEKVIRSHQKDLND